MELMFILSALVALGLMLLRGALPTETHDGAPVDILRLKTLDPLFCGDA